jgi:hypothetical protein
MMGYSAIILKFSANQIIFFLFLLTFFKPIKVTTTQKIPKLPAFGGNEGVIEEVGSKS